MISESLENTRTQGQVTTARQTALQAIMRWLGRIAVALFAIGIVVFVLLPFYWMLKVQTNSEIIAIPTDLDSAEPYTGRVSAGADDDPVCALLGKLNGHCNIHDCSIGNFYC